MKRFILYFFFSITFFCTCLQVHAQKLLLSAKQQQALAYIDSVGIVNPSTHWKNVQTDLFIKNLRNNITNPLFLYGGNNTNFCGYAAVSYTCIRKDPFRYAKFMIDLFVNGEAYFHKIHFKASQEIKQAAGLLRFKGVLDINHADQIWFLTLADKFKGYLNYLNMQYNFGDENTFWAATNFSKFNRMLRKMCNVKVHSVGSDLIRPSITNIPVFLESKLKEGEVFLYLNNTILHKKNHEKVKRRVPTHFVVLLAITETDGMVNLTFWDYGFKTLQQIPIGTLRQIIYGVSSFKKDID